jgi:hypothetical protein
VLGDLDRSRRVPGGGWGNRVAAVYDCGSPV